MISDTSHYKFSPTTLFFSFFFPPYNFFIEETGLLALGSVPQSRFCGWSLWVSFNMFSCPLCKCEWHLVLEATVDLGMIFLFFGETMLVEVGLPWWLRW